VLKELRKDLSRYVALKPDGVDRVATLRALAETQGVWATTVYRFGQWSNEAAPKPLRPALKAAYLVAFKAIEMTTGICLPSRARIGGGLYIGHFGGIIIHPDVVMGEGCSISQGVTIGVLGGDRPGVPRLGNRVYVGAGAKILGDVTIGDGATIGANAVVLHDVPAGATAVGIPARIVTKKKARISVG
jgi:serine O-acetyltransferase